MEKEIILVKYSEIGIKSRPVRKKMEDLLIKRLKEKIDTNAKKTSGRIILYPRQRISEEMLEYLALTPGVKAIAKAIETRLDIEEMKSIARRIVQERNTRSVAVRANRLDKNLRFKSIDINKAVGEELAKITRINLDNPEMEIFIDIDKKNAYIYTESIKGIGGLPVGSSGKAIALISGGIDSPVASILALKRGLEVAALHLKLSDIEERRVKETIEKIKRIYPGIRLVIYEYKPILESISKELRKKGMEKYMCIICKRTMIRIATSIAKREGIRVIIMGNNLAQVASQTLNNLESIHNATDLLILEPLIGMDKEEIIDIAKRMGTFPERSLPKCAYAPRRPATRSDIVLIERLEKEIFNNKEF